MLREVHGTTFLFECDGRAAAAIAADGSVVDLSGIEATPTLFAIGVSPP
jgi:hypothetical protein